MVFWAVTANPVTGEVILHVNGRQVAASGLSAPLRKYTDGYIGSTTDKTGFFNGEIAEVNIYDIPLSPPKIRELYQQDSKKFNDEGGK